jgi:glycosyltransferase involved in cell wall biosynthesis
MGVADCFVIPSLWEGGPYALLEAMAAGVPVVGASIPGVLDWVRDGDTGYESRPGGPASLAKAIVTALSDPTEAGRRADAAREMVLRRNTEKRWLREMAYLYEGAAAEARRRIAGRE